MSTTIVLVAFLTLVGSVAVASVALTIALLVALWRWARRTDTDEPEAAEEPESDAAAVEAVEAFFSGSVPVVPDEQGDLLTQSFESRLYEMLARHDRGEDVTQGAPRERL